MTSGVLVVMACMRSNYNTVYIPDVVVRNGHLLQVSHGYSIAIFQYTTIIFATFISTFPNTTTHASASEYQ